MFNAKVWELVVQKRASPQDDLVSRMVLAQQDGEQFSDQELRMLVGLIIMAGYDTMVNLLGLRLLPPRSRAMLPRTWSWAASRSARARG